MYKFNFLIIVLLLSNFTFGQEIGMYRVKTMLNISPGNDTYGDGCQNWVTIDLVYTDGKVQVMNKDLNSIPNGQTTYVETVKDILISRVPTIIEVRSSRNWMRLTGCGGNGSFNSDLRTGDFDYCTNNYTDIVRWWNDQLVITNTPLLQINDFSIDGILPINEKIVLQSDIGFSSNEYNWQYSINKINWIDLPLYATKSEISIDAKDIFGFNNAINFLDNNIYFRQKSTCNTFSNEVDFVIKKYSLATQLALDELLINGSFKPELGKYIISGWVKEETTDPISTYTSVLKVELIDANSSISSKIISPIGNIIDGWQRMVGIFEIQNIKLLSDPSLKVQLQCNSPSGDCYFDDIRFYPYNGNMKSFVYDEDTQRLMAELDENNYATFYEYDLEGGLVRVKKETERGVYTIQETRSNNYKSED